MQFISINTNNIFTQQEWTSKQIGYNIILYIFIYYFDYKSKVALYVWKLDDKNQNFYLNFLNTLQTLI